MLKVVCPNCKAENKFQTRSNFPTECSFCWEPIPERIQITGKEDEREIIGLTITYLKTNEKISIDTNGKKILGRNYLGDEVFRKIRYLINGKMQPTISRPHFSIEFNDGNFYLFDEGSRNGTLYGVNKLSCKDSPQIIEDKNIFLIADEAFIAQINYKEEELNQEEKDAERKQEEKNVIQFRCRGCGNNFGNLTDECPDCGKYNSLIPVYE